VTVQHHFAKAAGHIPLIIRAPIMDVLCSGAAKNFQFMAVAAVGMLMDLLSANGFI
jgi:hypothetical protein